MKKRIETVLTLIILTVTTVYGQNYEPLDLAKKIFSNDSLLKIENYIIGEYEGSPNGQDLQTGLITKFTMLGRTEKTAVVAMTILDSLGKGLDTYLHFEKDTVWKMSAFRALALTGIIEQVVIELEKMSPQQVDSIILESKNNDNNITAYFNSKEEYDFLLGNSKLTLELDENLINHFLKNKDEFERLKDYALEQLKKEKSDDEVSINLIENYMFDYKKLFISSVSSGGYELGNCINFLIGGMVDNSLGYIYVKDKSDLPEMNPNRIIMIREIGDGWYIYKTT